nr:MAG: nonstructural protein [Microvirus sp.]
MANRLSGVFSVYDRAAECFRTPFFAEHAGVAIRGFTDAINNPEKNTDISMHPDDFDLYYIGHFDSDSGKVTSVEFDKPLIQGKQLAVSSQRRLFDESVARHDLRHNSTSDPAPQDSPLSRM